MNTNNKVKQAFLLIIFAGIMWGTSGIFVHYLTPYGFSSLQMTAVRGTVSFICLSIFALITNKKLFIVSFKELFVFVIMGLLLFFTAFLYYSSIQKTSISTAVMLMGMAPVYVVTFSTMFLGEKLTKLKLFSIIGVLLGGVFVSGVIGETQFSFAGILMGVMSGVCYGAYSILAKISTRKGYNLLSATLYGFFTMAVVATCVSNPIGTVQIALETPFPCIPLLIGLGVITYVIPYTFYTVSMKNIPAGTASVLGIIEPLTASLSGIALFHEKLTIFSGIGILLILVSVVLLGRETTKE